MLLIPSNNQIHLSEFSSIFTKMAARILHKFEQLIRINRITESLVIFLETDLSTIIQFKTFAFRCLGDAEKIFDAISDTSVSISQIIIFSETFSD